MSKVYAFIVCHLRIDPPRKTKNCVDFSVSLRTSDTSEYRFYSTRCLNVTDSVPVFTALWVYSHKLQNFSKAKKHIRKEILVLKDHKCH